MTQANEPAAPNVEAGRARRTDWLLLGLLVLFVLPLRVWLLCGTEVAARDSIGYIRYALAFEKMPWDDVLETSDQHPGYPIAVWAVSVPVRAVLGATNPRAMQLSAQLVSLIASLLLLLPTYHLGRLLLGRAAGFGGSLLFQFWPVTAHHLSDGISEPLFLLLAVTALCLAASAVVARCPWRFALCGLFTGLAYLTRPEGILVLPAATLVLAALQLRPTSRVPWRRFAACGACLLLATLLSGSVYVAATGRITNKISARAVIDFVRGLVAADDPDTDRRVAAAGRALAPGTLLAATYPPTDSKGTRLALSLRALLMELNQSLHYAGTFPALLGLWWCFGSLRRRPEFWVVALYAALHTAALLALALVVCYVSDRHTMVLVLLGSYLAAFALCELPRRLFALWNRGKTDVPWRPAATWAAALIAVMVAVCLPRSLQRLHGNRAGNHAAGLWLAEHVRPGEPVIDDHAWSHFYAGMLFTERSKIPVPAGGRCYVVLTRSRDRDDRPGRRPWCDEEKRARKGEGELVYQWPARVPADEARITVRALPLHSLPSRDRQVTGERTPAP